MCMCLAGGNKERGRSEGERERMCVVHGDEML